jgi:hypothetical protein
METWKYDQPSHRNVSDALQVAIPDRLGEFVRLFASVE